MGVNMGLKQKFEIEPTKRFKEFDEARVYIENWEDYQFEMTCSAIDYMLIHKEYYYLLKTIYHKRFCEGVEKVVDYLFSRMECLSRQEDKEMIFRFLQSERLFLQDKALYYMLGCCKMFDLEKVFGIIALDSNRIKIIAEFGECISVRKLMARIQRECEDSKIVIEKFFEVYGSENVEK